MADQDTIRILLATDNHLGYLEKDPIRGEDSFLAFREILEAARERDVDMILLAGDLFHDNKPSRQTLYRCMELLREYALGDRPSQLEFLSDARVNFADRFGTANYLDPNYNVSIPIFTIHGNHDDPAGEAGLSAVDVVSVAGLLNYFGKARDVDDVVLTPVRLAKGRTKLALYGVGSIRDERLHRAFQRGKVRLEQPPEDPDDHFNLLLFHQNRASHGPTSHIPEDFLADFLHFVLWGHEHESIPEPQYNPHKQFYVCQLGSSVATALSEGEAKPKHIAILSVCGTSFEYERLPLRAVRPFVLRDVSLSDFRSLRPHDPKQLTRFLTERVEELLTEARTRPAVPGLELPLVRLRVDYSGGYLTLNPQRFGQQFVDRVANPKDLLLFYRKRTAPARGKRKLADGETEVTVVPEAERPDVANVEDLILDFLTSERLSILPENEFGDAIKIFVDKDEKSAIGRFIDMSLGVIRASLKARPAPHDESSLKAEIDRAKQMRESVWQRLEGDPSTSAILHASSVEAGISTQGSSTRRPTPDPLVLDSDLDENDEAGSAPPRGHPLTMVTTKRGRGRGASTRGSTSRRGAAQRTTLELYSASQRAAVHDDELSDTDIGQPSGHQQPPTALDSRWPRSDRPSAFTHRAL